ncbi:MAG: lamin tail domain-containing protein [Verrucomicrobiales bacterium]|nr:lamin tail domain-containing protein [Verrucomicrobiales bacterium]
MRHIPFRVLSMAWALVLGACQALGQGAPVELVPVGATARYFKGTAEPSPGDPSAWRTVGFEDASWATGPGPFWYGEAALFGGTGTEVADMQNQYSTLFLRHRFLVTNPAAFESLQLNVRCDDGFIAWINGRRIGSTNAPTGEPTAASLSSANAAEPPADEPYPIDLAPEALLVPGTNVLAIQVFNTSLGSSDIVLASRLTGTPRLSGSPTVLAVDPAPGLIHDLDHITVTFNEPVQGVRAEDFLVNGASATGVTGSGAVYTFSFPRPPFGGVGVFWSTFHTIQDFESPPRRFDAAVPGSTWEYEFLDPDGPTVLGVQPPPGSTQPSLTQVEVTFNKAVAGLDAADLLLNGQAALGVSGLGAGPYLFEFAPIAAGTARLEWSPSHGIATDAVESHPFAGGGWEYTIVPGTRPAAVVLNEFMAENLTSYRDEDADPEDWIELRNAGSAAVNLEGWSLSNDREDPSRWVFPAVTLPANGYLVVFASAKDRRPTTAGARLHTNFKLNPTGGYLALHPPTLPREPISELAYPEQGPEYSYARESNTGAWRYFKSGSPGQPNGPSAIRDAVDPVHFSVERGFFAAPIQLSLSCPTPGASIRFTLNGSPPTESDGILYTNAIPIPTNRVIRAAAFRSNSLPSRVTTHTYLIGLTQVRTRLPALSLVTATNHLFGRNGIMEVNPRNTTKRGAAWERPVSVEFIRPEDNGGFQTECGLRLQGGDYVRGQYTYRSTALPQSKYSYRLYFRGEYGQGRLEYPLFPETTQRSFDTIVLRAGMNDHSNPFILDEFVRTLARDCEQPSPVGNFVHLFLNGVYKGYYNPCERVDVDFLRAYHGGGEKWDLMAQFGEVREGDATAWNTLRTLINTRDLSNPTNYLDIANRIDLVNFIDYLCPLIYVDNDDWPHNNWRAARERVPSGRYRFYVWDAEWSFGTQNGHGVTWNTIQNQLSSTSPPWGGSDIQRIFIGLRKAPEFRQLFADRVHRHFFNGGPLTDERIRSRYNDVTNRLKGVVSSFNNVVASQWIPNRRRNVLLHFDRAGLLASSNAPVFARHGGRVPAGTALAITNLTGPIYYTTNGTDPRLSLTGVVAAEARVYTEPLILSQPVIVRARTLSGTNWSALTEAAFEVSRVTPALRFTEIMYHPADGDAFEFLELANLGDLPVNLTGYSLEGVQFRFPDPTPALPAGARWILANGESPTLFAARYPGTPVAGWFGGSLANSGERIALIDRNGALVTEVTYGDQPPWPTEPDGTRGSLEFIAPDLDPNDPAAWQTSPGALGSPGSPITTPSTPRVLLSEIAPSTSSTTDSDWIELTNPGPNAVALGGWSLSDNSDPRRFVFPAGTSLPAGGFLRVWCDSLRAPTGLVAPFDLNADGETLALYDPQGARADAVTFGSIPTAYSLGRAGANASAAWVLCEPTPMAPNEPATLGAPSSLVINEWLPNPASGQEDWIELHNTSTTAPIALHALHVATSNAVHQLRSLSYLAPSGFLVLHADERPGPDHLPFKLPAAAGRIALLDETGLELDAITYRAARENVALGRFPDGTGTAIEFPSTPSPGASNYLAIANAPRIHEWLARNEGVTVDPQGRLSDWVELQQPAGADFDLAGATFQIDDHEAFVLPAGTVLRSNARIVLWANPSVVASTNAGVPLHLGRGLPAEGATLTLRNRAGQILDQVQYGPQLVNRSAGVLGAGLALLSEPTPGGPNAAAHPLAAQEGVRLNEWRARAGSGEDFVEVYNRASLPVDLGGCSLTDDPSLSGITRFVLPPLSFLPANGHVHWIADGRPGAGPNHLSFTLAGGGETLRLYTPSRTPIDTVDFPAQRAEASAGRFPDGTTNILSFVGSESPGHANWLAHPGVAFHEILAHTDPPLEDALELSNPSSRTTDLSGWFLSDDVEHLNKFALPAGTVLGPGDFHVLYENFFNPPNSPAAFTLNAAHGGEVWLSEASADGTLTGRRAYARFPATANAESYGRHRTSVGWDWAPLSRRTFGKDLPATVAEFRTGTGLPNAYPRVGPLILSELLYRPLQGPPDARVEAPDDEYVELFNPGSQPINLFDPSFPTNVWRLRGALDFDFPSGSFLAAGQRAVVVAFSPTNLPALAAFRDRYALPAGALVFGPFSGRLSNEHDDLRLEAPDTPQAAPHPDAGFVPRLLVDRVHYRATSPWPLEAATSGLALHRKRAADYGNDPGHWFAGLPTPAAGALAPTTDRDLDGMPNDWELAHGLNPDEAADAALDADADSLSNLAEYLAGTDPRNPSSALRLTLTLVPSTGPNLRFRAVADRGYTVVRRLEPDFGPWEKVEDFPSEPFDRDISVRVDTSSQPTQFFQVITPLTP